ncbi:hypothetical protein Sfum_3669 [Syntrophobacter fumaroxidans MPOB]|uniref:Uncharacterized protein n=1 Tax=Syntrophobacter fumaroxidans (strain DSM 10017 / MPOB) TaxID=335543 RepID=A0LPI7_SYNFM|nr:hypothetical protein Sfum_3669 [Syntrophobacter fumaroxidans MPOB]
MNHSRTSIAHFRAIGAQRRARGNEGKRSRSSRRSRPLGEKHRVPKPGPEAGRRFAGVVSGPVLQDRSSPPDYAAAKAPARIANRQRLRLKGLSLRSFSNPPIW